MRHLIQVLDEIEMQVSLGPEDIAFYDDAILIDKKEHFFPLCAALRKRFPGIRFHTPNGLHIRELDGGWAWKKQHLKYEKNSGS